MAWFLNHYHCGDCGTDWDDEWSCMCNDECPECGARHMSPVDSDDLTYLIEGKGGVFSVLYSPENAEHYPKYIKMAEFTSEHAAELYVEVVLRPQAA
ncbi:MAG: hypothetical protein KKH72_14830 [Alphaproteobacteria bacterium]|nr:hypothetical protein [Alphaproteobacteria bacterium]